MKRLLSGLLSLVMVFSLTPSTIVFADGEQIDNTPQSEEESGTTGSGGEETTNVGTTTSSGVETGGATDQNGGAETTPTEGGTSGLETKSNDENTAQLGTSGSNSSQSGTDGEEDSTETVITQDTFDNNGTYYIKSGGTYTIQDDITTGSSIVINTTGKVTLKVRGNVEFTGDSLSFIQIENIGDVEINASTEEKDYQLKCTNYSRIIEILAEATVTLKGGVYVYTAYAISDYAEEKTLTLNGCAFTTLESGEAMGVYTAVAAKNIEINNCNFDGTRSEDILVRAYGNAVLKGKNVFAENSTAKNVKLSTGATFILDDSFDGTVKVSGSEYDFGDGKKHQITTTGISKDMLSKVTSGIDGYVVGYAEDEDGKGYLYLWKHTHSYGNEEVSGGSLIRKCSECDDFETLVKLTAKDANYTGKKYDEDNNVSYWPKVTPIKFYQWYKYKGRDGTKYDESATPPTQIGKYTVTLKVEDAAGYVDYYELSADFEIKNTIAPSTESVTITKGGTYNIEGGDYEVDKDTSPIIINTEDSTAKVILNIKGNINLNKNSDLLSRAESFVDIQSAGEVVVNATKDDGDYEFHCKSNYVIKSESSDTSITVNGGQYHFYDIGLYNENDGLISVNKCTFESSNNAIKAKNILVKNCSFDTAYEPSIFVLEDGNVTFEGEGNSFENHDKGNVKLSDGAKIKLDDFKTTNDNSLKVILDFELDDGAKYQVTKDTSEDLLDKIESTEGYTVIKKGGNAYFHKCSYDSPKKDENLLVLECTNSDCDSSIVLATLKATDSTFTSKSYGGASVEINKSYEDLVKKDDIKYEKKSDTKYSTTAPTQVGDYTVSVDVTYNEKTYTLTKDFKITNTISPSDITDTVTITKSGTYNIEGGTYSSPIVIDTSGDVTLCIKGNLDFEYSGGCDIEINSDSGAVTINGTKNDDGSNSAINFNSMPGFSNDSQKTVTFNDVRLHGKIYSSGELVFNNCNIDYDNDYTFIYTTYMEFNNCTFGSERDICVANNGNVKLKGQNVFDDSANGYDIDLSNDSMITLDTSFTTNDNYKLKVKLSSSLANEGQQQITTTGTSKDMLNKIESTDGYTAIYKDNAIYFWNHTHTWAYKVNKNIDDDSFSSIIANCTSKDCEYHNDDLLDMALGADSMAYSGESYTGAQIWDATTITSVTGEKPSDIYYEGRDGTSYTKSTTAPIEAGKYTASVTLGGVTATASFEITKADQDAPSGVSSTNETIKGKKDGTITGVDSSMEYRKDGEEKYTSINGDSVTSLASGIYHVRYKESDNYNASDDVEIVVGEGIEDKTAPSLKINLNNNFEFGGLPERIPFNIGLKEDAVITITATDDGIGVRECNYYVTDKELTKKELEKVDWKSGNSLTVDEDGKYIVYAQAIDKAGNVSYASTTGFTIDRKNPVIKGIKDKGTYLKTQKFTVEDDNLYNVKVDGNVVTPNKDGKYTLVPKNGSYEISASDTVGNTTSITVTVNYEEVGVPSIDSKTYTGKTLKADIEDSDLYTVTKNDGGINVDTYSVELKLTNSTDYKWAGSDLATVSVQFEITKAKAVVNVTSNTLTYNGTDQVLVTGSTTGGALYYQLGDGDWSTDIPVGNGAGTYVVNYKVDGGTNYNNTDVKSVEVVIGKADPKLSVSAVSEKMYGDKEFKLDVKQSGNGTLSYSSSNKDVVTVDSSGNVSIVGAGSATLTVSVKESDNYNSGSATVTVKVTKKGHSLVIDTVTYNKTYGDDSFSLGATSDGKITYTSSDSKVATVDKDGNVSIVGKGTAMITATVDGDSNYIGVSKTVKVVVSPKSISKATVTLGDVLSYTGSEQTQEVKSVVVDGMTVDTYKVSGNKVTDAGNHTLTVTGTGNFDGTVSVDYVVVPTKASQMKVNSDGKISYGKGTITVDGNVLNSKTDLVEMLIKDGSISSSELNSIYSGNELSISLKITDVSNVLDDSVKSSMKVSGFTLGNQFLDISLYKGNEKIHTTSGKVKITIDVPDELINRDSSVKRTYYVIRNHNGEVSSIDGTFNEKDQTFTFETDKFSAYALSYKDTSTKKSDTNKKTDQKSESKQSTKKSTNTGVQSNMGLYISLVIVSMIGLVVLVRKKRFE